jgi:tRNA G18 (ribose-2'-O)-methylase SpoU
MYHLRRIENFEDAHLAPYRTMRRQREQRLQGIFVAEGEKVVRRLLHSGLTVVSVLLPEKWFHDLEPTLAHRPEHIEVFVAEKSLLETLTGFSMYQGLLAVGKVPAPTPLAQVLAGSSKPCLLAAADGLSSAQNLGALVRNCAAFGVQALVVSETCSSPFLRRAVRSSMGTVFELPTIESASLRRELEHLRAAKVRCIAAHAHAGARTLAAADFQGDCCIVFGSEGYGISPGVLEVCDEPVAIPMAGRVDSLNVGSAAAAFFYEANRQRGKM